MGSLLLAFVLLQAGPLPSVHDGVMTTDDGVRIRYRIVGKDGPPVVIPAMVLMAPHFDYLASSHRVIYYDPRGRGSSDTGDFGSLSLRRNHQDLEALRQHLRIDKMALLGLSGLGMELAAYALDHPTRVTHLVQLAPVPPRQHPHMDKRWEEMQKRIDLTELNRANALQKTDPRQACRIYQKALAPGYSAAPGRIDVERICSFPNEYLDHSSSVWKAFAASIDQLDLTTRVGELRMPRLIIYGDRDLIPLAGVREWLVEGAPVTLITMSGVDHVPHVDRPELVMPLIDAFLRPRR